MNREDAQDALQIIFRNVFDDDSIVLTDHLSAKEIQDWDSLNQIKLVLAMESRFKIKFTAAEIEAAQDTGKMIDLIVAKQVK